MMNYFIDIFTMYMKNKVSQSYEAKFPSGFINAILDINTAIKNTVFESHILTESEENMLNEQEMHNSMLDIAFLLLKTS